VVVGTLAAVRDPKQPEAHHVLGRAWLSLGELGQAIRSFENVIALDSSHGYALNNLGLAYLRANRNVEAADVLSRASELLPHVAYIQNNLGVADERLGRIDEAKSAYAQASLLSPKYVKAQVNSSRLARLSAMDLGGDAGVVEEAGEVEVPGVTVE
jgi:Flp pilus assembly protein TadD